MRVIGLSLTSLLLSILPLSASATSHSSLCQSAAIVAEGKYAIPDGLLQAITLVETGKTANGEYSAWPWTVNAAGRGQHFNTKWEAERYLNQHAQLSKTSIDVGCFQINAKWHGHAFDSAKSMLDPKSTADYAGSFLSKLYRETGDWRAAARLYHSRNKTHGARYDKKISAALETIHKKKATSGAKQPKPKIAQTTFLANGGSAGGVRLGIFHAPAALIEFEAARPLFVERE